MAAHRAVSLRPTRSGDHRTSAFVATARHPWEAHGQRRTDAVGRGGRDRTGDHLLPKQIRYRCATPRGSDYPTKKRGFRARCAGPGGDHQSSVLRSAATRFRVRQETKTDN